MFMIIYLFILLESSEEVFKFNFNSWVYLFVFMLSLILVGGLNGVVSICVFYVKCR